MLRAGWRNHLIEYVLGKVQGRAGKGFTGFAFPLQGGRAFFGIFVHISTIAEAGGHHNFFAFAFALLCFSSLQIPHPYTLCNYPLLT